MKKNPASLPDAKDKALLLVTVDLPAILSRDIVQDVRRMPSSDVICGFDAESSHSEFTVFCLVIDNKC